VVALLEEACTKVALPEQVRMVMLLLEEARTAVALPEEARTVTRVNSTNVQYEGLRIREIGHRMNSKVKSVKQGVYQK
jgi:DNA-directed RNA polymerase specialized sigma24 family protein